MNYYYLTTDTMAYVAKKQNALLERIKKYFTDNWKLIIMGLTMMSSNYVCIQQNAEQIRCLICRKK